MRKNKDSAIAVKASPFNVAATLAVLLVALVISGSAAKISDEDKR